MAVSPQAVPMEGAEALAEKDEAVEESRAVRTLPQPYGYVATQREVDEHDVLHYPFRSWCKWCVRARDIEHGHRAHDEEADPHRVPTLAIDCFFMCQKEEQALPMLAMKDLGSRRIFATMLLE